MTTRKKTPEPFGLTTESLDMAEDFVYNAEPVRLAREAGVAAGLVGVPSNGVCATLTFMATVLGAKAAIEIGTGTGVTALALFDGMADDGVLTSVDADADCQIEARRVLTKAGVAPTRIRLIAGLALEVLPKLRAGAYDLVFVNGDKLEYVEYVAEAHRLLRSGGVLVLNDALWANKVADPRNEDDEALIIREALQAVQDDNSFTPLIVPLGEGLLAAVKA